MIGKFVYKIVESADLAVAQSEPLWRGSAVDLRDGFVHLSSAAQVAGTLAAHFRGKSDLALLRFDAAQWAGDLKWEPSRNGEVFPHLYAPLDVSRALETHRVTVDADGMCALPELAQ